MVDRRRLIVGDEDLIGPATAITEGRRAGLGNEIVTVDLAARVAHHGQDFVLRARDAVVPLQWLAAAFAIDVCVRARTTIRRELHRRVPLPGSRRC